MTIGWRWWCSCGGGCEDASGGGAGTAVGCASIWRGCCKNAASSSLAPSTSWATLRCSLAVAGPTAGTGPASNDDAGTAAMGLAPPTHSLRRRRSQPTVAARDQACRLFSLTLAGVLPAVTATLPSRQGGQRLWSSSDATRAPRTRKQRRDHDDTHERTQAHREYFFGVGEVVDEHRGVAAAAVCFCCLCRVRCVCCAWCCWRCDPEESGKAGVRTRARPGRGGR